MPSPSRRSPRPTRRSTIRFVDGAGRAPPEDVGGIPGFEIRHKGRPVETLHAGEIFGEIGLIDGGPRIATAVVNERVELVPIDRPLFESLHGGHRP